MVPAIIATNPNNVYFSKLSLISEINNGIYTYTVCLASLELLKCIYYNTDIMIFFNPMAALNPNFQPFSKLRFNAALNPDLYIFV